MNKLRLLITVLLTIVLFQSTINSSAQELHESAIRRSLQEENFNHALKYLNKDFYADTILPDAYAYYLGVALYHFKAYDKSKKAFLKYIELTGEQAPLHDTTLYYVGQIRRKQQYIFDEECEICRALGPSEHTITCDECDGEGVSTHECTSCEGKGKHVCHTCDGSGIVVRGGAFGGHYSSCHQCNGSGRVDCDVCKGKKVVRDVCPECNGKGEKHLPRECTHQFLHINPQKD